MDREKDTYLEHDDMDEIHVVFGSSLDGSH